MVHTIGYCNTFGYTSSKTKTRLVFLYRETLIQLYAL